MKIYDLKIAHSRSLIYLLALFIPFFTVQAQNPAPVQTYYVSLPEDDIKDTLESLRNVPAEGCSSAQSDTVTTYFSFVVATDNAIIYYDHWEDDFEVDVSNPIQSTTEIWGDGDVSNGAPPGVTLDANDVLGRGDVVIMNNDVDVTTRDTVYDYDGGDKIASSVPLSFTRMGWGATHGTVLAGAIEQLATISWGTDFTIPVGEDSGSTMFEYTAVSIMAEVDGTDLDIDTDGDGTDDLSVSIDEGESYLVDGGIDRGATISSSNPVQAFLITGNICASYESRWYYLTPDDQLSSSYYSPVSTASGDDTDVTLYNPNASSITVYWDDSGGNVSSQSISAGANHTVTLGDGEGYHFYTTGGTPPEFNAVASIDRNAATHDWGFTLIPEEQLRQQSQVGMGPEWDPNSGSSDQDASPIYMTAVYPTGSASSGTIDVCIDYDGDGAGTESITIDGKTLNYDADVTINELEQQIIVDPDDDNTGTMFFICDGSDALVVVAWGQDPSNAGGGSPALDVGTSVPAFPDAVAIKKSALTNDLNADGYFDVGETITYTVRVDQAGNLPVPACAFTLIDNLPSEVTYVANSSEYDCETTVDGVANSECDCATLGGTLDGTTCTVDIDDDASGTAFPFDEESAPNPNVGNCDASGTPANNYGNGVALPVKAPFGHSITFRFDTLINSVPPGNDPLVNTINLTGIGELQSSDDLIIPGSLGDLVYIDANQSGDFDAGEGVDGVTLTLKNDNGDTVDTTTTASGGAYLFEGLAPDNYDVIIDASNFNAGQALEDHIITIDPDGGADDEANYDIDTNEDDTTADFGYQPVGTIGDKVYDDANFDGDFDATEGVNGVTVNLLNSVGTQIDTTTTAGDGDYSFTDVIGGDYTVEIDSSNFNAGQPLEDYVITEDPDGGDDDESDVTLAVGASNTDQDFGYLDTTSVGSIGDLVYDDLNNDGNYDAGEELSGVVVNLLDDVGALITTDTTDASGNYSFTNLTPDDYTVEIASSNFNAGQVLEGYTNTVDPDGGTADEADETISAGEDNTSIDFGYEQIPLVTLSVDNDPIVEDGGVATFTATLSNTSSSAVTVNLGYSGTATGGSVDYTRSGTQIVIAAGDTTGTVTVTADDDNVADAGETVVVDITTVVNGTEDGVQQEQTTITDDDLPEASILVDADPILEDGGVATFTVSLNNTSVLPVTVNLGFSGTATGGSVDYTRSGTQVVIAAGDTMGSITVTADDDNVADAGETVIVDITSVVNGVEDGVQQDSTTITDDDFPTVTLDVDNNPIAENGGVATFTVELSNTSTLPVTVDLGFSGTATGGSVDYTRSGTQVVIAAGDTTGTITVTADDDNVADAGETVIVDITSVTNGTEDGVQQEQTVITDDDLPTVTLDVDNNPIAENGGVATFTVELSNTSTLPVTVDLGFSGTATGGSVDYTRSGTQVVIAAGDTTGTITVTADDDNIADAGETVVVDITSVTNGTEDGVQQEQTVITDDDFPTVTLDVDNNPIAENGGVATFTVELSNTSTLPVTVDLGFSGTATGGSVDYTRSGSQVVIAAGDTTGTVTVTADDDNVADAGETVVVDITSVTNGTEDGVQQEQTVITDDDFPTVTLDVDNNPIVEDGGVATFTVELSNTSTLPVTVDLGFSGTATGGSVDYTRSGTQVVIAAGDTTGSITVTADDDNVADAGETVIVDITSVTNGTEDGVQQEQTVITDDDFPTVTLDVDNNPIVEDGGVATFTVELSNTSTLPVTVDLGYSGTATGGSVDYTRSGTQVVIAAGDTTGSITVTADDDNLADAGETVIVDITSVTNGAEDGVQQEQTVITDDDFPTVTLDVDNNPIVEDGGVATFTVELSNPSTLPVTVDLGFSGTATGGSVDYTRSGTQVVIAPGDTTGTVTVTADDDNLADAGETVIVDITSVTNGAEDGVQQEQTVITDDDFPTVTLDVDNNPIVEDGGLATFTVELSNPSTLPVTVDLGYSGTATGGSVDYTRSGTQVVIAAGDTTGTVTVTADDDNVADAGETVIVDITSVTNGAEDGVQQEQTVITDDDFPTVTLDVDNNPIVEDGGVATFTVELSNPSDLPVTVDLGFSGTATGGSVDYTRSGTQVVIAAGDTTGSITVTADDDNLADAGETVVVDITSVTNGAEDGVQQEQTVITDDDLPTVTLDVDNNPIAEDGGVATFTVELSNPSTLPVTVDLGFSGTATGGGTDYTRSGTQVVIAAGDTTGTVTVTADDDNVADDGETVIVDITSVTNGTEDGVQQEQTVITDDDFPTVTLDVDNDPIDEDGGVATFTVELSNPSTLPVTVDLAYTGTATGGGTDYTASGTQVVIAAGDTTGTVTVTADDDNLADDGETVIVDITSVTNGTEDGVQQEQTTITDDDFPLVTISVDNDPIAEDGGVATFTVELSNESVLPVTVDLVYSGTATGGSVDYTASGTQVVIAPGDTTGTVTVTADDDGFADAGEIVVVDIDTVTNGAEDGVQQAQTTITDDDLPLVTLAVDLDPIDEDGGIATFTTTLSNTSVDPVTIDLVLSGTATSGGVDYTESAVQIVIAPGDLVGSITVTAIDDNMLELDEIVIVDIDTVTNGAEDGVQQAQTTIPDGNAGDDEDNDGIPNDEECEGGIPCPDTDGDGNPDYLDLDTDDDGIPDSIEAGDDPTNPEDKDQDGIPNYRDLNSDNDSILDIIEAGGVDADADGVVDGLIDLNDDGWDDNVQAFPYPLPDTDFDGYYDFLDIDSDDDGATDTTESQSTIGYRAPSGVDTDGDGVDDEYDVSSGGLPAPVVDTDGDGTPDYLDSDTDNDGIPDFIEANDGNQDGLADVELTGIDLDADGLDDVFDTADASDNPFENTSGSNAPLPNSDDEGDHDWRDVGGAACTDLVPVQFAIDGTASSLVTHTSRTLHFRSRLARKSICRGLSDEKEEEVTNEIEELYLQTWSLAWGLSGTSFDTCASVFVNCDSIDPTSALDIIKSNLKRTRKLNLRHLGSKCTKRKKSKIVNRLKRRVIRATKKALREVKRYPVPNLVCGD